jgi:hypothetical protein
MAATRQCSAKEVLAKLIRMTGGKLPSVYYDDILEWIPEAIDLLSQTKTFETTSTPAIGCGKSAVVANHIYCMPKDLVSIIAIEDSYGRLIPEGGDITDLRTQTTRAHVFPSEGRATVFAVNPLDHQTSDGTPTTAPGTSIPIYGEDIELIAEDSSRPAYYKISGNYIQFSFECGDIRLHYLKRPLDKEGYPLIPDNENFKLACAYYVMSMLIAAGYEHKIFSYQQCQDEFEKFGGRAIGEISYPSLDTVARVNRSFIRLIPPYHMYSDFFIGSEQGEILNK